MFTFSYKIKLSSFLVFVSKKQLNSDLALTKIITLPAAAEKTKIKEFVPQTFGFAVLFCNTFNFLHFKPTNSLNVFSERSVAEGRARISGIGLRKKTIGERKRFDDCLFSNLEPSFVFC